MSANQPLESTLSPGTDNPLIQLDFQPQAKLTLLQKLCIYASQLETATYLINEIPESKERKDA